VDGTERGAAFSTEEIIRVAHFRAALRRFMRGTETIARGCGLTPQRYVLLVMVKGAPNGSEVSKVSELADRLQLAQSTVTELVDRAVDAGLLVRRASPGDGRITHVALTDEGERRLQCAVRGLEAKRQALRDVLADLDRTLDGTGG
jgi:DNA-binding MarR family transcriptional regulator